jgi:hypothetical protein
MRFLPKRRPIKANAQQEQEQERTSQLHGVCEMLGCREESKTSARSKRNLNSIACFMMKPTTYGGKITHPRRRQLNAAGCFQYLIF